MDRQESGPRRRDDETLFWVRSRYDGREHCHRRKCGGVCETAVALTWGVGGQCLDPVSMADLATTRLSLYHTYTPPIMADQFDSAL